MSDLLIFVEVLHSILLGTGFLSIFEQMIRAITFLNHALFAYWYCKFIFV